MPFLEPDGALYYFDDQGHAIPYEEDHAADGGEGEGRELGSMPPSLLASARDYVARARYLIGQPSESDPARPVSAIEARRAIAKLERATTELRQGILGEDNLYDLNCFVCSIDHRLGDENEDRKRQAEVLLNTLSRDLERRRLSAGAQGLLISGLGASHSQLGGLADSPSP